MSTSTADVADSLAYLEHAAARGRLAEQVVAVLRQECAAPAQAFDALLQAIADVPRLVEIARGGLLDRALIQQQAGQRERAATVRELHDVVEMLGGAVICAHCSELAGRPISAPCPTIVRLDG